MSSAAVCLYITLGIFSFFVMFGGIHKIPEGHIGVYTRGGALLTGYTNPGVHFMMPMITKYHNVQVTVQTDKVTDIPCGTSGGVLIYFDKVEVVNRLNKSLAYQTIKNYTIDYDKTWIFDKIHHEINQFCSSHSLQEVYIDQFDQLDDSLKAALQSGCDKYAPGIEKLLNQEFRRQDWYILSNRKNILDNYEEMEAEKIKLLIRKEATKVKNKETETEKMIQKIWAETNSSIAQIDNQELILKKEGKQKIEEIENSINLEKQKIIADIENYKRVKEIEVNQKKLTQEYIYYNAMSNIKNINKQYFGENIPKYLDENLSLLPSKSKKAAGETESKKDAKKKGSTEI